MKFAVYDINKDLLEVTVFDKDLFSPNGNYLYWTLSSIFFVRGRVLVAF